MRTQRSGSTISEPRSATAARGLNAAIQVTQPVARNCPFDAQRLRGWERLRLRGGSALDEQASIGCSGRRRSQHRQHAPYVADRGFQRLVISRTRSTSLEPLTLIVAYEDFGEIAWELDRIASQFAKQSHAERTRHSYNELLAQRFPQTFPQDQRPYTKGLLVSFLRRARATGAPLAPADRQALAARVAEEAPTLARRNPSQLYRLQRDFEIAGLNELISRFEVDLALPHPERFWQRLLRLNPFILSMLFGQPVVLLLERAHVGGQRLEGRGETIADFLLRNPSTNSLALVEIKTPATVLLGREYRSGRFQPSADLNGAIIQVLDQRYELLINYLHRARDAGTVYAVDCVVVAGCSPTDPDQIASFEMYRSSLKDVRVYTFDEVLLKLCALRDYLAPPAVRETVPEADLPF
jgi:hypothetical protein